MNFIAPTRLTLAAAAFSCFALLAAAQDGPRYVPFEIDPEYQDILRKRFEASKKLEPLKDLVRQIMADPKSFPFDAEKLKDTKLDDENLKKMVQEWIASDPKIQESLRDWLKQNPVGAGGKEPDMKKLQKDLKAIVDDAEKKAKAPDVAWTPVGPRPLDLPEAKEDPLAKIAERALKQTERGKLGEWLRDSPAWKRAFDDLRGSMNNPDTPRFKLEGWQAKLFDPEGGVWKFGENSLEQLRNIPRPDFQGVDLTLVAPVGNGLPTPNFGTPGMPDAPSLSRSVMWILVVLLCLLVGWQLLRWRKRTVLARQARPDLGPWPVRPEAVATRADLVRAFDYLALWTLGLGVQSWNHHAVARQWRDKAPACADTAAALAFLYEQARYTGGAEPLSAPECALARQALAQIAEAL